jgi:hypothetical protein
VRLDEKRERVLASISEGYSPWLHLGLTVGSGLAVLAVAVWFIRALEPLELLVVPAMFLVANAGEWWVHRDLLHKRIRPFTILYDQHTPLHHVAYQYDTMGIRSLQELRLILIPPFGVAMITLGVAPFALLAGWLLTANCGWLVLVTAAIYVVVYELLHLTYHLPADGAVGRLALVGWLREHHRRHHDPRLMQRWNMNVSFPLWDVVRRTRISTARFEALTGERGEEALGAGPEAQLGRAGGGPSGDPAGEGGGY